MRCLGSYFFMPWNRMTENLYDETGHLSDSAHVKPTRRRTLKASPHAAPTPEELAASEARLQSIRELVRLRDIQRQHDYDARLAGRLTHEGLTKARHSPQVYWASDGTDRCAKCGLLCSVTHATKRRTCMGHPIVFHQMTSAQRRTAREQNAALMREENDKRIASRIAARAATHEGSAARRAARSLRDA